MAITVYRTKQKEMILNCLKNNKRHMTAEEIYIELSTNGNKVGIATVYRNLAVLVEESKIKRFNITNTACYQYIENSEKCKSHYHLKCTKCNRLYHVESPELERISNIIGENNQFCIDMQKIILYGKCKEC